ncbi:hypothetical protein F4778DRAFT_784147 [Xylariomycetidae sp. FL2044]|nr:hypothetical protein F4778DRAFT_784147 [Xylariomycetidae sp. FL2044]
MDPKAAAAAAAAAAALQQFVTEDFTLFAIGVLFTTLRTQLGSKIQLAGWSTYSALLWSLKVSLLVFYIRLTRGLGRNYTLRIYAGFVLLFYNYQPAISTRVVWVYGSLNILTDLYLLSIPIPMFLETSLKPLKKFGLIILFSGGVLVIIFAILRATFIITDPVNGAQIAGSWAVRETFVSVITTNLPMVYPLLKTQLRSLLDTLARYTGYPSGKSSNGGHVNNKGWASMMNMQSWRGRGPRTANPIPELTYIESEEQIIKSQNAQEISEVHMQDFKASEIDANGNQGFENNHIRQDWEVIVTSEHRRNVISGEIGTNILKRDQAENRELPEGISPNIFNKEKLIIKILIIRRLLSSSSNIYTEFPYAAQVVNESIRASPTAWLWYGNTTRVVRFMDIFGFRTIWDSNFWRTFNLGKLKELHSARA